MTQGQVIALINQWIVTNHNNEITAAILNPVLQAMVEQINELTGNTEDLTTSTQENLVAAINEINQALSEITTTGIQIYSGADNPNDVPPATFLTGDFYVQTGTNEMFQYNGSTWLSTTPVPVEIPVWNEVFVTRRGYGNEGTPVPQFNDWCSFAAFDEDDVLWLYTDAKWVSGTFTNDPANFEWDERKTYED